MSSAPVGQLNVQGLAPQLVSFRPERFAFVLHNSKAKPVNVMYTSNLMTVPAKNVVGLNPELDADGDPIPGTCVLEDRALFIQELGDEILIFNAKRAVQHILGIQVSSDGMTASATSRYAIGGLSLLPRHPTKEVWKSVLAAGEERAFLVDVDNAHIVIQEVDEKNAKRRAAGMDAVGGGPAYDRARFLVEKYNELSRKEEELKVTDRQADSVDVELELSAIAHAKAMELVTEIKKTANVDERELLNRLLSDPKLRKYAEKEWSIRKRGHMPVAREELDAAADAGLPAPDVEEPK